MRRLTGLPASTVLAVCVRGLFFTTCALASVAWAQLSEPHVIRSDGGCINVRPQPDTSTSPTACLAPGTSVVVVAAIPFWREITFGNNERGWAAKKFLVASPAPVVTPLAGGAIPADAFLEIHFVDVGQGDAIYIQTHDDGIDGNGKFEGYGVVVDGGPYSADASNPLLPYIEQHAHHGAKLEALIVTHPHVDHFKGAETISRHFDIQHYYDPGFPSTLTTYNAFLDAMRGTGGAPPRARNIHINDFSTLNWGSEIKVEVLYSYPNNNQGLGSSNTLVNNSSVVLRLQYGQHTFLFMGDAEGKDRDGSPATPKYVEARLLQTQATMLRANVLKIAHHGSETSSTSPFIDAVDPDIVIVESGRGVFGGRFLPDATTLQRYCTHKPTTRIYRTDQNDEQDGLSESNSADGDNIVIRTNGTDPILVTALEGGQTFNTTTCAP